MRDAAVVAAVMADHAPARRGDERGELGKLLVITRWGRRGLGRGTPSPRKRGNRVPWGPRRSGRISAGESAHAPVAADRGAVSRGSEGRRADGVPTKQGFVGCPDSVGDLHRMAMALVVRAQMLVVHLRSILELAVGRVGLE